MPACLLDATKSKAAWGGEALPGGVEEVGVTMEGTDRWVTCQAMAWQICGLNINYHAE